MLLVSGTVPSPLCSLAHNGGGQSSHACSSCARVCSCMHVSSEWPLCLLTWLRSQRRPMLDARVVSMGAQARLCKGHPSRCRQALGSRALQGETGWGRRCLPRAVPRMRSGSRCPGTVLWAWRPRRDTSCQPLLAVPRMTREGGRKAAHRCHGAFSLLGAQQHGRGLVWGCQAVRGSRSWSRAPPRLPVALLAGPVLTEAGRGVHTGCSGLDAAWRSVAAGG